MLIARRRRLSLDYRRSGCVRCDFVARVEAGNQQSRCQTSHHTGRRSGIEVGGIRELQPYQIVLLIERFGSQCKSTYCFCAHMHEITKYFLYTENQEQMSESVLSHPCSLQGRCGYRSDTIVRYRSAVGCMDTTGYTSSYVRVRLLAGCWPPRARACCKRAQQ